MKNLQKMLAPLVRDMGLRSVARASGVSHSMISRWLHGQTRMSIASQIKVAEAVGCQVVFEVYPPSHQQSSISSLVNMEVVDE